ncbi:MAG TPA: hypothetical protein VJG90_00515 [Candidatus Nanoarchaeia archaeon]|nr:hypothetical protein [Candidatus Nanoarchaeia archaeon]
MPLPKTLTASQTTLAIELLTRKQLDLELPSEPSGTPIEAIVRLFGGSVRSEEIEEAVKRAVQEAQPSREEKMSVKASKLQQILQGYEDPREGFKPNHIGHEDLPILKSALENQRHGLPYQQNLIRYTVQTSAEGHIRVDAHYLEWEKDYQTSTPLFTLQRKAAPLTPLEAARTIIATTPTRMGGLISRVKGALGRKHLEDKVSAGRKVLAEGERTVLDITKVAYSGLTGNSPFITEYEAILYEPTPETAAAPKEVVRTPSASESQPFTSNEALVAEVMEIAQHRLGRSLKTPPSPAKSITKPQPPHYNTTHLTLPEFIQWGFQVEHNPQIPLGKIKFIAMYSFVSTVAAELHQSKERAAADNQSLDGLFEH